MFDMDAVAWSYDLHGPCSMSNRFPVPCNTRDCPNLVPVGKGSHCPTHARAISRQRGGPGYRAQLRARASQASAGVCAACGSPGLAEDPLVLDHILSLSLGGDNDPSNLRLIHRSLNARRVTLGSKAWCGPARYRPPC